MFSLYGLFYFNPVTKILWDVLDISYCDNIKTWMKYCVCWNFDSLLQWLLFPIPIGVLFHETNILCLDKKFTSRNNFFINIIFFCICQYQLSVRDLSVAVIATYL